MERYKTFRPTQFDHHIVDRGDDNHEDWSILLSKNRDSVTLDRSNFETVLNTLGGESDNVRVARYGHWACGWFELLLVRPSTREHDEAKEIEAALADFPVFDEMHFSDLEYDEASDYWVSLSLSARVDLCREYGASIFAARHDTIPENADGDLIQYLAS